MHHLQKLAVIKEQFKGMLVQLLSGINGNILLVWESKLMQPISLVADFTSLKEKGVTKMFIIDDNGDIGATPADVDSVVFVLSSDVKVTEFVAKYLLSNKFSLKKQAYIIFVPRKTSVCENLLKNMNVMTRVKPVLLEYPLDILPYDSDLMVMNLPFCFSSFVLNTDISDLYSISRAIMTLQCVFGIIPNIAGKGIAAKRVYDNLIRMRHELNIDESALSITPQIDNLILIDRSVDLLTPLIPQQNFEGLIDEVFNISHCHIKLNMPKDDGFELKKITLNSADEQFANLRDRHIHSIGIQLSQLAKQISAKFDARHQATTVSALKEIVTQLPHLQATKNSLAVLTTITERLQEYTDTDDYMDFFECQLELIKGYDTERAHPYIEECIALEKDFRLVIRLICIQSYINGGLKSKLYQYYLKELVQVYGIDKLLTIHNLSKAGLLTERLPTTPKSSYSAVRTTLNLTPDGSLNEETPKDINYVCSGYAPLSVRLVQKFTSPGWRSIRDCLDLLPGGKAFEERQQIKGVTRAEAHTPVYSSEPKLNLVVFIGGATYSEISALRFLSQLEEFPAEYLILTTSLFSPNSFVESVFDPTKMVPLNPFSSGH